MSNYDIDNSTIKMKDGDIYIKLIGKEKFEGYAKELEMLNGEVELYPCFDTLQVLDYSKFNMGSFDETKKKEVHEKNFPKDLENAYQMGKKLSKKSSD